MFIVRCAIKCMRIIYFLFVVMAELFGCEAGGFVTLRAQFGFFEIMLFYEIIFEISEIITVIF